MAIKNNGKVYNPIRNLLMDSRRTAHIYVDLNELADIINYRSEKI